MVLGSSWQMAIDHTLVTWPGVLIISQLGPLSVLRWTPRSRVASPQRLSLHHSDSGCTAVPDHPCIPKRVSPPLYSGRLSPIGG